MENARWGDLFREGRAVYTVSLALGIALHAMDAFIVSTVMPSVVADIGGTEFYAWVVMLYMTMSIVGAASGGPIKLMFGARNGYVAAGFIFLVGTLVSANAPTMPVMLVGRAIQGLGAGMIVSQNVALISELFPPKLRARMIAITSGVWATSAIIGPTIGGIFAEMGWWRGAFWFAVPIILSFTIVSWRTLPKGNGRVEKKWSQFPIWRVALLGSGVLFVGVTSNIESIVLRIAAIAFGLFIVWLTVRLDRSAENRVFPTRPFSPSTAVGAAYLAFLLIAMAPTSVGVFMPLAYQTLHGLSPLVAGYLGATLALGWSAGAVMTAQLQGRGESYAIVIGPILSTIGLLGVATSIDGTSVPLIVTFTVVTGFGIGISMSHLMTWTMLLARKGEETITASSIHTIRSLGVAFGAAGAGLIANAAGLGQGVSVETVASAVTWVTSLFALAPAMAGVFALMLIFHRRKIEAERAGLEDQVAAGD